MSPFRTELGRDCDWSLMLWRPWTTAYHRQTTIHVACWHPVGNL